MKNVYKLLVVFVSALVVSCGDVEPVIYNGNENQNDTFLSFSRSVYSLPIVVDDEGTVELVLNSSTVSNVDRVYNLAIDAEASTADPAVYNFPSTITIPAGSYFGTAEVTGEDINVTSEITTVIFSITNVTDEQMDTERIQLNIFQVCPLLDDFTGTYTVQQLGGFGIDMIAGNNVVELVATGEYDRAFTLNDVYIAGVTVDLSFTMTCGQTTFQEEVDTFVGCGGGINIIFGPAANGNTGSYDSDDDSQIDITFTEDVQNSCGGPAQTTLRLTKVE